MAVIVKKNKVLSANSFALERNSCGKSLMEINANHK